MVTVMVVLISVSIQLSQHFIHSFTGALKSNLSTAKSTVSISLSYHLSEKPPNPSFIPHTKPGLQFNSPSVASLKYYPRNEIRAPEYRV